MKNKYKIALVVIALCLSITFLFGTSYALWQVNKAQEGENKLVSGCFEMEFQYENVISLDNDYPMSDANGMKKSPYKMTVTNTCNIAAKLNIVMNIFNDSTMEASKMKLAMSGAKTKAPTIVSTLTQTTPVGNNASNAKIAYDLGSDHLEPGQTRIYEFKLWIDEQAGNEVMNQIFKADFVIEAAATKSAENAVTKLTELAKSNTTEMFIDDTTDANIRYMGENPANYVDIGNGTDTTGNPILWRIIGVMNNVDDGTGNKETRLKIRREYTIDGGYSSNNNWLTNESKKILNGEFLNGTGNYLNNGLTEKAKSLIGNAIYHLGGPTDSNYQTATARNYYDIERSSAVYSGNPTTWTGMVGLLYPSDYGYATGGELKSTCASSPLSEWNSDCVQNNWIYYDYEDTITPMSSDAQKIAVITAMYDVSPGNPGERSPRTVPVVYLKSDVKIMSGDGTKANPYKLGL